MGANIISDRLFYSQVLCKHLDRISEQGQHLFDIATNSEGQAVLPTSTSRMASYWGQIVQFESFLFPNLSKRYFEETKTPKAVLDSWKLTPRVLFGETQQVLRALMLEAHNKGLLFRGSEDEEVETVAED